MKLQCMRRQHLQWLFLNCKLEEAMQHTQPKVGLQNSKIKQCWVVCNELATTDGSYPATRSLCSHNVTVNHTLISTVHSQRSLCMHMEVCLHMSNKWV